MKIVLMPQRRSYSMARSQSHKKSGTPDASKSQELFASLRESGLGRKIWAGLNHPATLQLFSVALMLGGLLTIATIAGVDTGTWGSAWARFLVLLFGWGAYPTGALITAVGLLLLRHIVHQPTVWRWRPFLGMELTLVGLLAITHTVMRTYGWALVESGRGGGLVGWAVSVFFSNAFGPLITNVLMSLVTFLGIALAFDVTTEMVRDFGKRLVAVWEAQRAMRRERRSPPPAAVVQQVSRGVMTSPIPGRETKPTHSEKPRVEKENLEQSKTSLDRKPATSQPRVQTAKPATKKPRSSDDNLPALGLLEKTKKLSIDNAEVIKKQEIIKETLAQFGVPVEMTKPRIGPTVTQFGVSPGYITKGNGDEHQRKVRVNQIASLADDLALALAAQSLRVEAPVPGRAVVGIEVPNDEIALVRLRSVLESVAFEKCGSPLCFAAGLDVAGEAIVADLAKMPHLLVAGTTGSGKSIFMKALAASLIMNNSPEDLR
ncbi:MAG: DNA translocase FtsK, partial [Anaerolineae bacterium]|nr:DNA translocase FtsK [Anaerolineae bacterium]